jgi:hypothetical protein
MTYVPYSYKRVAPRRFVFTSVGRSEIKKVVEFVLHGNIGTDRDNETILFNAEADLEYLDFLIKRIN